MNVATHESWQQELGPIFDQEFFLKLTKFIENEYATQVVYPPQELIFNAFDVCPLDQVKVVILGQDPYHGVGQAHGLSFSVLPGLPFPLSLQNIFKEIKSDLGVEIPASGDLTRWARQGVFLLNATLTVRAGEAGSHQKKGWEEFTDRVIQVINQHQKSVVFLLWGAYAQKKVPLIDSSKHLVLQAPHPSPLSAYRGFLGCRHFSQANAFLEGNGRSAVRW